MAKRHLKRLITRRKAKWAGLVLCALLVAVFVSSRWMNAIVVTSSTTGVSLSAGVHAGRLVLGRYVSSAQTQPDRQTWYQFFTADKPQLRLWVDGEHKPVRSGVGNTAVLLPLWMPLLLLAIPTAWLWRVDRRAKRWQCQKCRYDLRGLESEGNGACPECGTPKKP